MEANIWAYRAVNHHCEEPTNGHYTECDKPGSCAVDVITDFPGNIPYGPGSQYTINTEREFHIKINFYALIVNVCIYSGIAYYCNIKQ